MKNLSVERMEEVQGGNFEGAACLTASIVYGFINPFLGAAASIACYIGGEYGAF